MACKQRVLAARTFPSAIALNQGPADPHKNPIKPALMA
jgi:hypothetical protein